MNESMTRRRFLASSAALSGALATAPSCTTTPADRRPNIILLMGDDHGWEETGYNGHPFLKTPVLDEMAQTGLRMDRFYSAAPVCSPTRSSVLTGRHPNRCGTLSANYSIRPEEITIAQLLGQQGYACGHFGKWHVGTVKAGSPTNPGAMGFDEWLSHDNFFEMDPHLSRNGAPPEQFQGESSEILIREAADFIAKAKEAGKPSFTIVWYGSPHEPYSGLEKDLALYKDLPAEFAERQVMITDMVSGEQGQFPQDKVLQARFAEITAMDRSIGQLRQFLSSEGLRDNTMVWYCGDNGVPPEGRITETLRGSKGRVYEGGVKVPAVMEWPERIASNRVSEVNGVTSDMLPTICEAVGVAVPDRPLDGISLQPMIDGSMNERPEPICFWSYDAAGEKERNPEPYIDPEQQVGTTPLVKLMDGKLTRSFTNFKHPEIVEEDFKGPRAILDNQYKLVVDGTTPDAAMAYALGESTSEGPAEELFDVRSDPAEQNSLVEGQPEVAADLGKQLRDWQQSVLESLTGADYS